MKDNTNSPQQLSLFETTPTFIERLAKVTWSYSKRSVLIQCPRKYYYEYYGANKRTAKNEPLKGQLHFLKKLQNRYERTGALLHLMISQYLKKARAGDVLTFERLRPWVSDIYQKDINFSAEYHDEVVVPDHINAPILMHEFYYKQRDANTVCVDAGTRMIDGLRIFFESKIFGQFRFYGANDEACIEQSINIPSIPCKVDGKLDLAYQNGDYVYVVDWKSGEHDGSGNDSLQLAVYAIWAKEHFGCSTEQIRIYKAYLGSDELVEFPIDDQTLRNAWTRIVQDAEHMISVSEYGEDGIAEAFTPCGHAGVCALCSYRQVCPGKGEDINDRD